MLVFGWPNSDTLRAWAKLLPNQDINEIKGCYHHWFNEDELINADLTDYSFFIVISEDLGISDDSIFLTFSLAHELEHVVQYSEERVLSLQAGLIISYLSLSNQWNNSTYQDFPPEMDAFRTAKQINFILHSEDKTQAFIDRRISESSDPDDSAYWQHINTPEAPRTYVRGICPLQALERLSPKRGFAIPPRTNVRGIPRRGLNSKMIIIGNL